MSSATLDGFLFKGVSGYYQYISAAGDSIPRLRQNHCTEIEPPARDHYPHAEEIEKKVAAEELDSSAADCDFVEGSHDSRVTTSG